MEKLNMIAGELTTDTLLIIRLVSGQEYHIKQVLLFDRQDLSNATTLRSQAIKKLGGFQSGLGSIGDLGYVLTSSLIIGAVEGALSANMKQEGLKMLETAETMLAQSRLSCSYFSPFHISNISVAMPQLWWAMVSTTPTNKKVYVHNGDPMIIALLQDDTEVSIMWDKVETYRLCPSSLLTGPSRSS